MEVDCIVLLIPDPLISARDSRRKRCGPADTNRERADLAQRQQGPERSNTTSPIATTRELQMDPARAHELIERERARVKELLTYSAAERAADLEACET